MSIKTPYMAGAVCIAFGAFIDAGAADDKCREPQTTVDIDACGKERFDLADRELNATYKRVLTMLDEPDGLGRPRDQEKKRLVEAQRHWVKFREANCDVVWLMNADGTVRTSLNLACMEEIAKQREEQLRKWFLPKADQSAK